MTIRPFAILIFFGTTLGALALNEAATASPPERECKDSHDSEMVDTVPYSNDNDGGLMGVAKTNFNVSLTITLSLKKSIQRCKKLKQECQVYWAPNKDPKLVDSCVRELNSLINKYGEDLKKANVELATATQILKGMSAKIPRLEEMPGRPIEETLSEKGARTPAAVDFPTDPQTAGGRFQNSWQSTPESENIEDLRGLEKLTN